MPELSSLKCNVKIVWAKTSTGEMWHLPAFCQVAEGATKVFFLLDICFFPVRARRTSFRKIPEISDFFAQKNLNEF